MATLQENINNQIENTYNDNQLGQVDFKTTSTVTLVLSPPYADLLAVGDGIDSKLLKEMQSEVDWTETGHLFMIRQGRIVDHCLLSFSAEPILEKAEGTEFIFTITRIETSGRPIAIEMKKR